MKVRTHALCGTTYNSQIFSYNPAEKQFDAEISEVPQVLRQLWNDSCDIGFGIKSHRTGQIALFTLKHAELDSDGDALYWDFEIYNPTQEPKLNGVTARIYND